MQKQIIFENFYEIIDYYLNNYVIFKLGKVSIDCVYGSIEFVKTLKKSIIVHEIFIGEQYRNQGLCREFIKYLIDNTEGKKIIIQSVLSKILYDYLIRFEYTGKKFILKKEGFVFG